MKTATSILRTILGVTLLTSAGACGGEGAPRATLVLEPGVSARVVPGDELVVEGQHVQVETEGHVIRVFPRSGKEAHAYVQHPDLQVVRTRGNAEVEIEVGTRRIEIDAAGTSRVVAKGELSFVVVETSGDAQLDASSLIAKHANVDMAGNATADIHVTGTVTGEVSGSARLVVRGGASILGVDTVGSAQVDVE